MWNRFSLCVASVLFTVPAIHSAGALALTPYASVTDPVQISFSPSGDLYVGRDNVGSVPGGDGDAVPIHRVGPGGTPVVEFGPAIPDPDSVLFDAAGLVAPVAGSILVGGASSGVGTITAIAPDESTSIVLTSGINIGEMIFDGSGNMIFSDSTNDLKIFSGGTIQTFVSLPDAAQRLAYDPVRDRVYVQLASTTIAAYTGSGVLIDSTFATDILWNLTVGPGTAEWSNDLYAVTSSGILKRIDEDGNATTLGFVGRTDGLEFNPAGDSLFFSNLSADSIGLLSEEPPPVPEPGTAGLVLLGLGGIAALRHRFRNVG